MDNLYDSGALNSPDSTNSYTTSILSPGSPYSHRSSSVEEEFNPNLMAPLMEFSGDSPMHTPDYFVGSSYPGETLGFNTNTTFFQQPPTQKLTISLKGAPTPFQQERVVNGQKVTDNIVLWNTDAKQEVFCFLCDEENNIVVPKSQIPLRIRIYFEDSSKDITNDVMIFGRTEAQEKTMQPNAEGMAVSWSFNFKHGYMTIFNSFKTREAQSKARESFCCVQVEADPSYNITPARMNVRPRRLREDVKKRQRPNDNDGMVESNPDDRLMVVHSKLAELDDKVNYILRVLADVTCSYNTNQMSGPCADFAEYFEKADHAQTFNPGEIVGMTGGRVTFCAQDSEQLLVVTSQPLICGNVPATPERKKEMVRLALVGQVPMKTIGVAMPGDLLVGLPDIPGMAVACPQDSLKPGWSRNVVGVALEKVDDPEIKMVHALVVRPNRWSEPDVAERMSELESALQSMAIAKEEEEQEEEEQQSSTFNAINAIVTGMTGLLSVARKSAKNISKTVKNAV